MPTLESCNVRISAADVLRGIIEQIESGEIEPGGFEHHTEVPNDAPYSPGDGMRGAHSYNPKNRHKMSFFFTRKDGL